MYFLLTCTLSVCVQIGPGSVSGTHSAPGEDMVPEQTHEMEENGESNELTHRKFTGLST